MNCKRMINMNLYLVALTGNLTLNGTSGNYTELDVTEMWQSRMREVITK